MVISRGTSIELSFLIMLYAKYASIGDHEERPRHARENFIWHEVMFEAILLEVMMNFVAKRDLRSRDVNHGWKEDATYFVYGLIEYRNSGLITNSPPSQATAAHKIHLERNKMTGTTT